MLNYEQRYQDVSKDQADAYRTMQASAGEDRKYWEARYQALRIEARALEKRLGMPLSETKRGR